MKMQLADFPRWLRALFAVFLILFFFNALYALAAFTALITTWSWRVDPGVATLVGAIVGLCIVAWQARLGFTNLIRSQEHRAAIEMEARQHQHKLDTDQEEQRIEGERRVLMAALRAEIVGLWDQAQSTKGYLIIMRELAEQMAAANASNSTKSIKLPTFNAPVYQANVSKIGLLGASLGADVVRLMTRTGIVPPAEFDPPRPMK